jgi:hypothetical protein
MLFASTRHISRQSIVIPRKSANASRIAVLLGASIQSLGMTGT